jgi:DNA-binding transcriptional ArsR family regulator
MTPFVHPARDDITLVGILNALGDPARLAIVKNLAEKPVGMSCGNAAPCDGMARSTLSNHFRVLRESGLIFQVKKGVENINTLRRDDIEARFPGLLAQILKAAD